ncbi:MAG TPA: hypothetical protein VIG74_00870 [Alphaproteobacteria bacterium]
MVTGKLKISAIAETGIAPATTHDMPGLRNRDTLDALMGKFNLPRSATGHAEADIIEDWTTLLIWLTEKSPGAQGLSTEGSSIMLGALCAMAECLARHAGEDRAFCMMLTVNAANRAFFAENPVRPLLLSEMAKRQRDVFAADATSTQYIADIARATDALVQNGDDKERMKIAVAVSNLLKTARSALGTGK